MDSIYSKAKVLCFTKKNAGFWVKMKKWGLG